MASASLNALTDEERQSIQSESSVILGEEMADKKKSKSSSRSTRKSSADKRMDSLEKKFDEKFSSLLEMMKSFGKSQERTVLDSSQSVQDNNPSGVCRPVNCEDNNPSGIRQPLISIENDLNRDFGLEPHSPVNDDTISITPGQREKDALGLLSEDEHCGSDSHLSEASVVENTKKSERFCQYLHEKPDEDSVNYLKSLFGDDISSNSTKHMGLCLDQAQEDILSKSWRCKDPEKLTAYKEDNKTCFPVHEKSESLLQVPSLDDLLEPMLLKKHGSKSVKAWGKSKQLASQPLKAIESVAFQGQMATRLGIISMCYIQQALGSLLNKLQSKEVNIDSTVQSVRDIFAMSTKALDQVGRTGAFHHIIRRKAAVSDTGLNNLKDVQAKVLYLPLTGDGVFGKGLEENLKKRKEQKEQLVDLIPEYDTSKGNNSQKRKFSSNDRNAWSYKKPRYDYLEWQWNCSVLLVLLLLTRLDFINTIAGDCGPLTAPQNGNIELSNGTSVFAEALFSCHLGYNLIGSSVLKCLESAQWNGTVPTCEKNDCGPLLPPANGSVSTAQGTTLGSVATYSCDVGFLLNGSDTRSCGRTKWKGKAPKCNLIDCGPPAPPANGSVSTAQGTTYLSVANYSCEKGFLLRGSNTRLCGNETWGGRVPECTLIDCGPPTPPANGSVSTAEGTTYHSVANYSCDVGFLLNGSNTRVCGNVTWEGTTPECNLIDCGPPTSPADGSVSTAEGTTYLSVANYSCDVGFLLNGSNTRVCGNVTWEGTTPECNLIDCGPPSSPANGSVSTTEGTTYLSVANYSCDAGFLLNGTNTRVCGNETWEGRIPECHPIDCGPLSDPPFGLVFTSGTAFQQSAVYRCDEGYSPSGTTRRTCEESGDWSGAPPACQLAVCSNFSVANGDVYVGGTAYGSTANVSCYHGYRISGPSTVVCQSDGTWTGAPTCNIIDCGPLEAPLSGRVDTSAGVTFGQTATYSCDFGYTLFGNETRQCTSQGWDGAQPVCELVACRPLFDPLFGSVTITGTTPRHSAIYKCNEGYMLVGASRLTCEENGDWSSSPPTCQFIDCGPLTHPLNGTVDTTPGTTYKKTAAYTCKAGFTLMGTNLRVCGSDSQWDRQPPVCVIKDCDPLTDPLNGKVNTSRGTTVGDLATYDCDPGYSITGARIRACLDTGLWSGSEPTCNIDDCPTIPDPLYGQVNITGTQLGQIAIFRCDHGYRLVGQASLVCETGGQWNNAPPACQLIDCAIPPDPVNGRVNVPGGTLLSSMIEYICNSGYKRVGPSARMCTEAGEWSGEEPRCETTDCGAPPSLVSGSVVTTRTTVGGIARYECDRGHKLEGPQMIECLSNGEWSESATSLACTAVNCESLPTPINGFKDTQSTSYQTKVVFHCMPGYQLRGFDTTVCTETGEWSQEPPVCETVGCSILTDPVNGLVDTEMGTTFGSIATYYCLPGYDLIGTRNRVCGVSGEWEGSPPFCQGVDCGDPIPPQNGLVDHSYGTTFGKMVRFSCVTGYYLDGTVLRECGKDGEWMGIQPVCKLEDCGNITHPSNGRINAMSGTGLGHTANFSCNLGYSMVGADTIVCEERGRWSNSIPVCVITDCGDIASPKNGTVSTAEQTTTYGQVATFSCNPGYQLVGAGNSICQPNGNWSVTPPVCEIRDCGPLSRPAFGSVSTPQGTTYSQKAFYSCNLDGYALVGSQHRVCQANGTWSGEKPACTVHDCGPLEKPENGNVVIPLGTKHGGIATFSCNYGYRLTGGSASRICINGSWSGSPTGCRIKVCGRLENPENGVVNVLGLTYESSALYTCLPGYDIDGSVNRTCLGNGSWSDAAPLCVPKECGNLTAPDSGSVRTPNGTTFGETAIYECEKGYALIGTKIRLCLGGGNWSFTPPTCRIHDCGPLSNPTNGKVDVPGSTLYRQIATYTCFTGYKLQGQAMVTCEGTGKWSGTPTCTIKDCGFLASLQNGRVDISAGTTFTKVASYTCNRGYELIGTTTRMCQATGNWSRTPPNCDAIDCHGLSHPADGVVSFPFGTTYGESVIYTCNPGYYLTGNDTRTCEHTGSWSGEPPRCRIKGCGDLIAPLRGTVTLTGTKYGATATYTCDPMFEISGVINRQCLSDGKWSAAQPSCVLQADLKAVFMAVKLNVSLDADLSDPDVYEAHKDMMETTLLEFYQKDMGTNIKAVMVTALWEGSLNVDFQAIIVNSEEAARQFSEATYSLVKTPVGVINNFTTVIVGLTVNNSVVNVKWVRRDFLTCLAYTAASPCDVGYMCIFTKSTPSCVPDPATDCGPLSDPDNGQVDTSEGTTYGKTAAYTCNPGYRFLGDDTRLCQTDGQWSDGAPPVCYPIDCGSPDSPVNGFFLNNTRTTFGGTVTYRCDVEYSMSGHLETTCEQDGSWNNPPPSCILTSCESIQSLRFGSTSIERSGLGHVVTYRCQDGYSLMGATTRVCQNATTAWTGSAPICTIRNCGVLSNPVGGLVDLSDGTTFGSVATYRCTDRNYKVTGGDTRFCGVSGTWSGSDPVCLPKKCEPLDNPFGGSVSLPAGRTIGSTATFTCKPGFEMSGPATLTCSVDGRWSDDPPVCISLVNCPTLSDPALGQVVVDGNYQGAVATYSCNHGYRLIGNTTRKCLSTEIWSRSAPSCEIQDCGNLREPTFGSVSLTTTTYGSTGSFTCDQGYGLVGTETVVCMATGNWSDTIPTCVPNCPSLFTPRNGKLVIYPSVGINAGLIVTFTCDLGYDLVGDNETACQGGVWNGTSPVCVAKDCGPLPNITNGQVGFYNSTTYGQTVTYSCSDGYVLQGSNPVVCRENSTWSEAPSCLLVDCGPPVEPEEGIVISSGTLYGQTATYSCSNDFIRVGPAVVTCLETGEWSHNTSCQRIDCGPLLDPVNGSVNISSGTTFSKKAFYSCDSGFRVTGGNIRICTADGWSGMAPVCAVTDCGRLDDIPSGNVSTSGGTTYNQVATYTCDFGYALIGVKTRSCMASGYWSDNPPSCRHFDCGPLNNPSYGSVDTSAGTNYSSVAVYECNPGYYVDGSSRRQCQDTGSWSGSAPICRMHDCGKPEKPKNGKVTYSSTSPGAVATYRCDIAHSLLGNINRTCGDDGKWNGTKPRCDSQRGFALALGLGLGVGLFLIIVMVIIVVLIVLYNKRYRHQYRYRKRKPSYFSVIDSDVPLKTTTIDYYPLYLPDDKDVYPLKMEVRRENPLYHPEDRDIYPLKTDGRREKTPSYYIYSPESDITREQTPAPSYKTYDSGRTSLAHVEKLGKQEYYVPYIDSRTGTSIPYSHTESRPQSSAPYSRPQSSVPYKNTESRPQSSVGGSRHAWPSQRM